MLLIKTLTGMGVFAACLILAGCGGSSTSEPEAPDGSGEGGLRAP